MVRFAMSPLSNIPSSLIKLCCIHIVIVTTLTKRSTVSMIRSNLSVIFLLFSSLILFGGLFLIWLLMNGKVVTDLSSEPYAKLDFRFLCTSTSGNLYSRNLQGLENTVACKPTEISNSRRPTSSATDLIKKWADRSTQNRLKEYEQVMSILSSLMMNGLPLVGIDDYINLSDYVNQYLRANTAQSRLDDICAMNDGLDNFLNVRSKKLIFTPNSTCTREFVTFLSEETSMFKSLKIAIFDDLETAMKNCCDDVWAVIELVSPEKRRESGALSSSEEECDLSPRLSLNSTNSFTWEDLDINKLLVLETLMEPEVTIRMHPSAVPDTRNIAWTPIKRSIPLPQSGELLYFTSGFLSLQMEVQRFVESKQYPDVETREWTKINGLRETLGNHSLSLLQLTAIIMSSKTSTELHSALLNFTASISPNKPKGVFVPLYHRAFPTHSYEKKAFWSIFGLVLSIAMILFYTLPSAICIGSMQSEFSNGQMDVLLTLPKVSRLHSMFAWVFTSLAWLLVNSIFCYLFFAMVLSGSNPMVPTAALVIFGIVMAPISVLLTYIVHKPDSLVLAVPLFSFIMALPGLVYYDLAFDIQRSFYLEAILCLIPPSAVALILRIVCTNESIGVAVHWRTEAPVSATRVHFYLYMLLLDICLYLLMTTLVMHRKITRQSVTPTIKTVHGVYHQRPDSRSTISEQETPGLSHERNNSTDIISDCYYGAIDFYRWVLGYNRYVRIPTSSNLIDEMSSPARNCSKGEENGSDSAELSAEVSLRVDRLTKKHSAAGLSIVTLSHINAHLLKNKVTVLLGSNGAGKSTLMKILSGLDADYSGNVEICDDQGPESQRKIGWCPQNDALFANLTVWEHIQLYSNLLHLSGTRDSDDTGELEERLRKVNLLQDRTKRVCQLSGGMKRRLSLCLAFLGEPGILILDEPTSGCDSWTREIVRREILSFRDKSAVLVSTHHADDIEILADRVWFLNDQHLEIDASVKTVLSMEHAVARERKDDFRVSYEDSRDDEYVLFSTFSDSVVREVEQSLGPITVARLREQEHGTSSSSGFHRSDGLATWKIPFSLFPNLFEVIKSCESRGLFNWTISHRTLYGSLRHLYDPLEKATETETEAGRKEGYAGSELVLPGACALKFGRVVSHFSGIFLVRIAELRVVSRSFFLAQILAPFLVVLVLAFSCRDVQFPKVALSSEGLGGIGEVCSAERHHRNSYDSEGGIGSLEKKKKFAENLSKFAPTAQIKWENETSSEEMWSDLLDTYYDHRENRWGALVANDFIKKWLQTEVFIPALGLPLNSDEYVAQFSSAQRAVCNDSSMCSKLSDIELSAVSWINASSGLNESFVSLSKFESLFTNITLLSNVTTDHAAPVFLKELLIPFRDLLQETSHLGDVHSAKYRLFSHPFAETRTVNRIVMERGYFGATVTLMLLLILTTPAVRVITKLRASGTKRQLHMAGMRLFEYWIANWLFDASLVCLSFSVVYAALIIGGDPVKSFFFVEAESAYVSSLFIHILVLFALSSSASCFAFSCLSEDQLASQATMLFATVSGVTVLKLYLEHNRGFVFDFITRAAVVASPSFAFATANYEMFKIFSSASASRVGSAAAAAASAAASTAASSAGQASHLLAIRRCLVAMYCQVLFYLLLTIAVDGYHKQLYQVYLKCRWLFSSRCFGQFRFYHLSGATERTIKEAGEERGAESRAESPVEVDFEWRDYSLNRDRLAQYQEGAIEADLKHQRCRANMGREMILRLPESYRIGIFPSIPASLYGHAVAAKKALQTQRRPETRALPDSLDRLEDNRSRHSSSGDAADLLEVSELCVGCPSSDRLSLAGVSLSYARGERVAVMGMNGGGKTTLFETCAMAERVPLQGSVKLLDQDILSGMWSLAAAADVAYVPQEGGLLDFLTVRESLAVFSLIKQRRGEEEFRVSHGLIDGFLPSKYLSYPVRALSGGTRKKLAVRLSNIGSPALLLLDECTTGVDPIAAFTIIKYLKQKVSRGAGQGLVFASHRIDESLDICESVALLADGQVCLRAPIAVFHDLVSDFYQLDVLLAVPAAGAAGGGGDSSGGETLLRCISQATSGSGSAERFVTYSSNRFRFTFHKSRVRISELWQALLQWECDSSRLPFLSSFCFRAMDLEEALSTIISSLEVK